MQEEDAGQRALEEEKDALTKSVDTFQQINFKRQSVKIGLLSFDKPHQIFQQFDESNHKEEANSIMLNETKSIEDQQILNRLNKTEDIDMSNQKHDEKQSIKNKKSLNFWENVDSKSNNKKNNCKINEQQAQSNLEKDTSHENKKVKNQKIQNKMNGMFKEDLQTDQLNGNTKKQKINIQDEKQLDMNEESVFDDKSNDGPIQNKKENQQIKQCVQKTNQKFKQKQKLQPENTFQDQSKQKEKLAKQDREKNKSDHEDSNEDYDQNSETDNDKVGSDEASINEENQQNQLFMNSLLLHNLNASHNSQRRRDIKQNYKAKLPLDKLEFELEKKRQAMIDLVKKRIEIIDSLKTLHQKIGLKQGISNQIDYDMHLQYLQEYSILPDENKSQSKIQKVSEDQKIDSTNKSLENQKQELQKNDQNPQKELEVGKQLDIFTNQTENFKQNCHNITGQSNQNGKTHWDFLLKEMAWMADDFDKEGKKKQADAKKIVKACKKHISDKQVTQERLIRELKIDLKRKSKYMSNIVQLYWKSCEKIVKHNYNVEYERKRQQMRTKKLENFVQKHLKLSVKVAEALNTKQFIQQSHYANQENQEEKKKSLVDQNQIIQIDNQIEIKTTEGITYQDKEIQENEQQSLAEQTVELAQNFLPTGHTLEKAQVSTKVPFLLKGSLREYQIIGMDWLVTLHNRKLNGILADEMGLGKTIQTISMLASLACDKGVWGPHLIIVPTTIIMNWEMEFKRWCPGFKILTYFGSQKERKVKRHGWSKDNSFHICITSYKLVIQDHFAFRRKKWYYMVLDEAQNIKNFKSQRWQTLLRFNTKRRLLLTGTPLQNDVMELWSLMHFLMPQIFSNQQDFKEWFSNPFSQSINQNKSLNLRVVQKLQSILRPFLLRRMKRDVEKQLPEKIEHIIQCNLSRRQRLLYDEYINQAQTQNVLADSDFFSIMGVLMQLRKVCNHPDLFEARTIESPFILNEQDRIKYHFPMFILNSLDNINYDRDISLKNLNLILIDKETKSKQICERQIELMPAKQLHEIIYQNRQFYNSFDDTSGVGSAPYYKNPISQNLMTNRPFQDGLAVGPKYFTNFNGLNYNNSSELIKTIPSIMPYENSTYNIYKNSQNSIPTHINAACIPFNQNFFSLPSYGPYIYNQPPQNSQGKNIKNSNIQNQKINDENQSQNQIHPNLNGPLQAFKSALQDEEQKRLLVLLAQKLSIFHSLDRQNRLQILYQQPIFGQDCRECIHVPLVCSDIFESKKFKYYNWQKYKQLKQQNVEYNKELYQMTKSVFNPIASMNLINNQEQDVKISDWEEMTDDQIEEANKSNRFIKEITQLKMQELRKCKIRQQREMKLKQTKKVQRKKEISQEYFQDEIVIEIDLGALQSTVEQEVDQQIIQSDINQNKNDAQADSIMQDETIIDLMQDETIIDQCNINEEQILNQNTEQITIEPNKNVLYTGIKQLKKTKVIVKIFDEYITYEQYLKEQKEEGKLQEEYKEFEDIIDGKDQQNQLALDSQNQLKINPSKDNQNFQEQQEKNIQIANKFNKSNEFLSISYKNTSTLQDLIISPMQRGSQIEEIIKNFKVIVPKCVSKPIDFLPSKIYTRHQKSKAFEQFLHQKLMLHKTVNQSLKYSNILFFPHRNLIQYDCGKLQRLAQLLKTLYNKGSKVIIFTQMTKMLDIFEQFLNLHGYIYVRLDGLVKTENRQKLVDRFNYNKKIFCFISSTRCGGVGINLTGADCVIFYDTDWNPAMDKQAQDRCHRIGQTKTVHIYRLISKNTIEENIFKKSLQKRELGGLIIEGNFDQEFFQKVSLRDIFSSSKDGGSMNDISNLIQPRRVNIFQDENIVFHGEGELQANEIHFIQNKDDEIILTGPIFQNENQNGQGNTQFDDQNNIDFETNSMDLEIQAREMEMQQQAEQYRRKFEEALIRIEDQEDVIAMQNAKREQNDNYDEDLHEFVAMGEDGKIDNEYEQTHHSANQLTDTRMSEENNQDNKNNFNSFNRKNKDQEQQQEQLQLQQKMMKEQFAKQKINDGISLTQGDLKKHELIEWNTNEKLNTITKRCLDFINDRFSFDQYLDERAQKDSKFVHLDEDYNKKQNKDLKKGNEDKNSENEINKSGDGSEFSFSEEDNENNDVNNEMPTTADHSNGQSGNKKQRSNNWDRQAAEQSYTNTKVQINNSLFQPVLIYEDVQEDFDLQEDQAEIQEDQNMQEPENQYSKDENNQQILQIIE